jgi:hypothetical protein
MRNMSCETLKRKIKRKPVAKKSLAKYINSRHNYGMQLSLSREREGEEEG